MTRGRLAHAACTLPKRQVARDARPCLSRTELRLRLRLGLRLRLRLSRRCFRGSFLDAAWLRHCPWFDRLRCRLTTCDRAEQQAAWSARWRDDWRTAQILVLPPVAAPVLRRFLWNSERLAELPPSPASSASSCRSLPLSSAWANSRSKAVGCGCGDS